MVAVCRFLGQLSGGSLVCDSYLELFLSLLKPIPFLARLQESFANPNGVVPQVKAKDVLDSVSLLVERLQGFDVSRLLNLGLAETFFNASMAELEVFKAELLDLQKQWFVKCASASS